MRAAGVERRDAIRVRVDAGHRESRARKLDGEGQSDVALTDDADMRGTLDDATPELGREDLNRFHARDGSPRLDAVAACARGSDRAADARF